MRVITSKDQCPIHRSCTLITQFMPCSAATNLRHILAPFARGDVLQGPRRPRTGHFSQASRSRREREIKMAVTRVLEYKGYDIEANRDRAP
jgi:hypothetical protein